MAHSVKFPIDSGGAKSSDIYKDVHMEMITSSNVAEGSIVDMSGALNATAALSASTAFKINENYAKNGSEQTVEKQGTTATSSGLEQIVKKESLYPKKPKATSTLAFQTEDTLSSLGNSWVKTENSDQSSSEVNSNTETMTPLKPEAFIDGIEKFVNFVSKEGLTKRKTETPVSKEMVSGGKKPEIIVPPEDSVNKMLDLKLNGKEMASKPHKKTAELTMDTKKVTSCSAEDDVDEDLKSYALAVNDMLESEVEVATDSNELDAEIKTIVVSNDDAGEIKMTFTDSAVGRFETIGKIEDTGSTLEGLSPLRKSSRPKKKKVYTDFDQAEDITFADVLDNVVEEVSKAIEDSHEIKSKPEPSKSKRKNPSPKKAKLTVEEVYESDSNEESDGDISKDILKVRMAKCDVCEKHFLDRKKLLEHKKRHKKKSSSQSDYPCLVCGKIFLKREHWRRHVKIHDDIRPFACPVCKKGFRRKEHVKRHMLIHTGEKPFECMFCSQRYQRADHLKKHLQQHTKDDGSYKVKKRKGESRPKANSKRRKPTAKAVVVKRSIKKETVEEDEEEHYSDGLSDDDSMAINDELE